MIEKHLKKFTTAVFIVTLILLKFIIGPVTCNSGWKSPSIGRQGACSHHGGVAGWKGTLPVLISVGAAVWFYVAFSPKTSGPSVRRCTPQAPIIPDGSKSVRPPVPRTSRTQKKQTKCPRCNAPMALRTARRGRESGSKFWGCKKYPRCKGTKPYIPD
ncbi:MAG: topoisomerase DNA-binding C4 zinc finger domain-containing protein [Pseudomonadota bacterium]